MLRTLAMLCCTFAILSASAQAAPNDMQLPPQPSVRPAGMPAGFMLVSPCVAQMGEHWANVTSPTGMTGPIYGTYNGKPIFSELMVTQQQLAKGFTYKNLTALPGYTINHVDFEFEPHGHPGMPFPHYDVHGYYITAEEQAKICPGGEPNPVKP